jgi:O-antigen/teichoic acid export membrane protein
MSLRRFWSHAGVMAAGQGVYALSQWGVLVVLARLAGPEALGCFALALAVTAPVMLPSNLALRSALVTDLRGEHGVDRRAFLRLLATVVIPSALLGGAGIVVAWGWHGAIMATFYGAGFAAGSGLLPWVMAAGLASFVAAGCGFSLTALRLFRVAPWLYGATCALTLAGGVLLAPGYGLSGIVLAWSGALVFNLPLTGAANLAGLARLHRAPMPAGALLGALR